MEGGVVGRCCSGGWLGGPGWLDGGSAWYCVDGQWDGGQWRGGVLRDGGQWGGGKVLERSVFRGGGKAGWWGVP